MSKKFNIREWVRSVKYWSLLFIPHISICLIFLLYTLVGASIIQEIESDEFRSTFILTKNLDREREYLLSKIIDRRQINNLQQYTKYVTRHILEYEEEIKKVYELVRKESSQQFLFNEENLPWTFVGSLYFIGTTLTTIGSNDFILRSKVGQLFSIIYGAIGIPLTLVFLNDLSLLIARSIKYLSLLLLRIYSTKYFLSIRQWLLFRFIEKQLNISIPMPKEEDDFDSLKSNQLLSSSYDHCFSENNQVSYKQRYLSDRLYLKHIRNVYSIFSDTLKDIDDDTNLTMFQLLITLFIYIIIGACLITSNSFFDSIYICFTCIFTINLRNYYRNATIHYKNNMKLTFILAIYLLFGVAIASLYVKAVQIRIQTLLENVGKKLLRDFVEFLRQMGFHELSTDDILATTNTTSHRMLVGSSESSLSRQEQLLGTSFEQMSVMNARWVGATEPVHRASNDLFIRAFKNSENDTNTDKSVQVNTIIRSCDRCAGSTSSSTISMASVIKHNAISSSALPSDESNFSTEDNNPTLTLPNMDRLRQRRATIVAKTIINQMATQPSILSFDEPMPPSTLLTDQRYRSSKPSWILSSKDSNSKVIDSSFEKSDKRDTNQEEFSQISRQISSLLATNDDKD